MLIVIASVHPCSGGSLFQRCFCTADECLIWGQPPRESFDRVGTKNYARYMNYGHPVGSAAGRMLSRKLKRPGQVDTRDFWKDILPAGKAHLYDIKHQLPCTDKILKKIGNVGDDILGGASENVRNGQALKAIQKIYVGNNITHHWGFKISGWKIDQHLLGLLKSTGEDWRLVVVTRGPEEIRNEWITRRPSDKWKHGYWTKSMKVMRDSTVFAVNCGDPRVFVVSYHDITQESMATLMYDVGLERVNHDKLTEAIEMNAMLAGQCK